MCLRNILTIDRECSPDQYYLVNTLVKFTVRFYPLLVDYVVIKFATLGVYMLTSLDALCCTENTAKCCQKKEVLNEEQVH